MPVWNSYVWSHIAKEALGISLNLFLKLNEYSQSCDLTHVGLSFLNIVIVNIVMTFKTSMFSVFYFSSVIQSYLIYILNLDDEVRGDFLRPLPSKHSL